MADITSGRLLPCLDSKSGVETVYLGKWVRDSGIIDSENEIIFSLPIQFYEYQAKDIKVSENLQHSDEGEIYDFSINVDLQGIDKETSKELNVLCDLLLVAIVQFENGIQKIYGFSSGCDVGLTETSGGGKNSFSGYNLTLKGEDEFIPYFGGVLPIEYPFFLDANGVTIKLKQGYSVGATGLAEGDTSGKVYTAVDDTTLFAMNPATDDYTSVCTTLCTDLSSLFFQENTFNQNISSWDTSNVTNMFELFRSATNFNQPLNNWNVSIVTSMQNMFRSATNFNQPLNNWNVSQVTDMDSMFVNSNFNQSINNWNVSSVNNMTGMFFGSQFNQPINNWDVSNVTNMAGMFRNVFNQDISSWNVSNVTNMRNMFDDNFSFNQNIGSWNTSSVTNMNEMFRSATAFNQDLSTWCVQQIPTEPTQFATGATAWVLPKPNWGAIC